MIVRPLIFLALYPASNLPSRSKPTNTGSGWSLTPQIIKNFLLHFVFQQDYILAFAPPVHDCEGVLSGYSDWSERVAFGKTGPLYQPCGGKLYLAIFSGIAWHGLSGRKALSQCLNTISLCGAHEGIFEK